MIGNKLFRLVGICMAMAFGAASADDFPSKQITMVIPFSAGGPTDTVGRLIAQPMGAYLKQTVVVENVGGAGGTLAAGKVARSDPDGYTIFLHHIAGASGLGAGFWAAGRACPAAPPRA